MTIKELNENQKYELKEKVVFSFSREDLEIQGICCEDYTDNQIKDILNKNFDTITDEDLEEWFGQYDFVEDDFFSSTSVL